MTCESMSVGLGLAALSPTHEAQEGASFQDPGQWGRWRLEAGGGSGDRQGHGQQRLHLLGGPGTREADASTLTCLSRWNPLPEL